MENSIQGPASHLQQLREQNFSLCIEFTSTFNFQKLLSQQQQQSDGNNNGNVANSLQGIARQLETHEDKMLYHLDLDYNNVVLQKKVVLIQILHQVYKLLEKDYKRKIKNME